MNFPKIVRVLAALCLGFVLGVGATVGAYYFYNRTTAVYTAKSPLVSGNIHIPAGTEFIYDGGMSEGFDRLALYLNVEPDTLDEHLERTVDPRPFLVIPYWIEAAE